MKIETILNAMEKARLGISEISTMVAHDVTIEDQVRPKYGKRCRQYRAFRDRIIRMDREKDEEIDRCEMDIELLEAELVTTDAG